MIVFQAYPCRLYPLICSEIENQFPDSTFIHEVFELKNQKDHLNSDNVLEITTKKTIFPRSSFTYGIFDEKKIQKKPGDFWFTIKFKKQDLIREYFAAIRYYSSYRFYKSISSPYEDCLYETMSNFNKFGDKELINILSNKKEIEKIDLTYKSISYKLCPKIFEKKNKFDYIGHFDNLEKTISDIYKQTNLDLSCLKNEKTKSFIKQ